MVYQPVELGTIRIGYLDQQPGKVARPQKLDQILVTTLVKHQGLWVEHPVMAELRSDPKNTDAATSRAEAGSAVAKLRSIPVRVQFNNPDLILQSRWEAYNVAQMRPVCASKGAGLAVRVNDLGQREQVSCLGAEQCEFASRDGIRCKYMGRLNVQIAGQESEDNGFVLRTTSFNTIRTIESKLRRYAALFKGSLVGVPLRLNLRTRTTGMSRWSRFYFLDIELDGVSLVEAGKLAAQARVTRDESGLDFEAYERVALAGLRNGRLMGEDDEGLLTQEFYAADGLEEDDLGDDMGGQGGGDAGQGSHDGLTMGFTPGRGAAASLRKS